MVFTRLPQISGNPPSKYVIYGVSIDLTNPDPETAVTYTDDAVGMTGGSALWDEKPIFKDIKPCLLGTVSRGQLGVVNYYLNKNNYNQKEDGSPANITDFTDGNVMVEFPKIGYQITTTGNILTVRITNHPSDPNFKYYAFTRDIEGDRDKLYIGAYKVAAGLSVSGGTPQVNTTIGTTRTMVSGHGAGYDILSFYPLTLLQCLFLIRFKNRNSQQALGVGYMGGTSAQLTGATNTLGMYYGNPNSSTDRVKCFGIEDLWGNVFEFIDGLVIDSSRNILTAFKDFNDTGSGYKNNGVGSTTNLSGTMSKPQGTSETGFIVKEVIGTGSNYFSDYAYLYASNAPVFGGYWDNGNAYYAGAFALHIYRDAGSGDFNIGSRLMYL